MLISFLTPHLFSITDSVKMLSSLVKWDRLVRYLAEGESKARYGEPILANPGEDDVAELASAGELQVKICEGSDPLSAVPTSKTQTVKTLLGPFEPKDVPIIRCIGLNYKTHSRVSPYLPVLPQ